MKEYSLIVIGAGISGLSTAISWLIQKREPVLVIEKQRAVGGCVASFARNGYKFDTVQVIPDMTDLLDYLGLDLPLVRYEGILSRLFLVSRESVKRFDIPAGAHEFEEELIKQYPSETTHIQKFFRFTQAMVDELEYLTLEPSGIDILKIIYRCPHIIRTAGDTWKTFLKRFRFRDQNLIETLDLFSSYAGLSGDRCAALLTVSAMTTSLQSSWRPEKAFITMPAGMVKRIRELGGEVRTGSQVEKLLIDDSSGTVRGVKLHDGEEIPAHTVVSTVDSSVFLNTFIGEQRLREYGGAYKKTAGRLQMSPSMISIHAGIENTIDLSRYPIDGAYHVLTTGRSAHENGYVRWEEGEYLGDPDLEDFHVAFYSPSLQTGDRRQTLIMHLSPVYAEYWINLKKTDPLEYKAHKEAIGIRYLGLLDQFVIPGLSEHISYLDVATPATFARYLGAPAGSCYDMMPLLSQFGLKRLPMRSPVKGLYHTKFSHGIWPAMHSGLQVVDMITGGTIMNGGARYVRKQTSPPG